MGAPPRRRSRSGGIGSLLRALPARAHGAEAELGFTGISVSAADTVVVPEGYTARVLIAWGDPVSAGPAFRQDASNTAGEQAQQWGMHYDGVVYFPIDGSRHGLLVQNHEYTDDGLLFRDGVANWTSEKTSKALNAHGVSAIEIRKGQGHGTDGEWRVVRPLKYARRITGQTPVQIDGPAAGDHPVGHLPGVRGELQRVLPENPHGPEPAGTPVRSLRLGLSVSHNPPAVQRRP